MRYWLMKTEPESFSLADLERVKLEPWTGVRNYMARNHMRAMAVGDGVLFYHSSCDPPGVAGLARVARAQVVDQTQFDPDSKYYDPKATRERPIWDCVEVEYRSALPHFVAIERMRADPALAGMMLLRRGMRLSVQPVTEAEYLRVIALGDEAPREPVAKKRPVKSKVKGKKAKRKAKRPVRRR
jgi:predicted RNA-binding protein with PUA-like domain